MSAIDDKYNALKKAGLDLGAPLAPEQAASSGGRFRPFANGNIYWHKNTGAHEVHGGILSLYLAHGGPGPNPHTGRRDLAYPTSDELDSPLGPRMNSFETGAIYWTPGTRGCVLYGALWQLFQTAALGVPLTGNTPLAGGTVVYCERGVLFQAPSPVPLAQSYLTGVIDPPLLGCPMILNPDDEIQRRYAFGAKWPSFDNATYDAITHWRPTIFTDLWQGRLALSPVGSPFSLLTLDVSTRVIGRDNAFTAVEATFSIPTTAPLQLKDRTLYDLQVNLPVGIPYMLSPHCLYARRNWDNFGLLHITDLHVNQRNDLFGPALERLGLHDAAQRYSNFQTSLRDFVKYANKLHALGLADAVMATGDLIDYVSEDTDGPQASNFARLSRLLLGQPLDGQGPRGEALQIPIFMTFGNHDYRLHPYDLEFHIDLPLSSTNVVSNYSSHNLIESDALALEGGKAPSYGVTDLDQPFRMIQTGPNPEIPGGAYRYFERYLSHQRTYTVELGPHRLVMLDTGWDSGVPDEVNSALIIEYVADDLGVADALNLQIPESTKTLMGGGTPSVGVGVDLALVRKALTDAGNDGVVIVGMHCPALSPAGHEYAYFFRETLHPSADPHLTDAFVKRRKLKGDSWSRTGTAYFKVGDTSDGMDSDAIANARDEFLHVCAGVGAPRPVDLVLYGHIHDRVEYRLRWNEATNQLEFYTDFYTENPSVYYHTINALPPVPVNAPIKILVDPAAQPNEPVQAATLEPTPGSGAAPLTYGVLRTPPYATPLDSSADPKAWWAAHRPVFAQTSALGPMDPRQRFGTFWALDIPITNSRFVTETDRGGPSGWHGLPVVLPDPPMQGFRLIQVRGGAIWRVRYVVLRDLRANNFTMPWETEGGPIAGRPVVPHPGPIATGGP